jgi:hypothetical protein
MVPRNQVIETTAGNDELARRGISSDERLTITIETAELAPGCLSDDDIDRLVKQAQHDVEPRP